MSADSSLVFMNVLFSDEISRLLKLQTLFSVDHRSVLLFPNLTTLLRQNKKQEKDREDLLEIHAQEYL